MFFDSLDPDAVAIADPDGDLFADVLGRARRVARDVRPALLASRRPRDAEGAHDQSQDRRRLDASDRVRASAATGSSANSAATTPATTPTRLMRPTQRTDDASSEMSRMSDHHRRRPRQRRREHPLRPCGRRTSRGTRLRPRSTCPASTASRSDPTLTDVAAYADRLADLIDEHAARRDPSRRPRSRHRWLDRARSRQPPSRHDGRADPPRPRRRRPRHPTLPEDHVDQARPRADPPNDLGTPLRPIWRRLFFPIGAPQPDIDTFFEGYRTCESFGQMFEIIDADWFNALTPVTDSRSRLLWGEHDRVLEVRPDRRRSPRRHRTHDTRDRAGLGPLPDARATRGVRPCHRRLADDLVAVAPDRPLTAGPARVHSARQRRSDAARHRTQGRASRPRAAASIPSRPASSFPTGSS